MAIMSSQLFIHLKIKSISNIIKTATLVILVNSNCSTHSNSSTQEEIKNDYSYQLTDLGKKVLDLFIEDSLNFERIDTSRCSIVFRFEDKFDPSNELWLYDEELLGSCTDLNRTYLLKYKGYYIFNNGRKISPKYFKGSKLDFTKKNICDELLETIPKEFQTPMIYDGCVFKIKKMTTIRNILIEKRPPG